MKNNITKTSIQKKQEIEKKIEELESKKKKVAAKE